MTDLLDLLETRVNVFNKAFVDVGLSGRAMCAMSIFLVLEEPKGILEGVDGGIAALVVVAVLDGFE
jgi:hypothetical protein